MNKLNPNHSMGWNKPDELREAIHTEFKQVLKLAPADYTENCTNVVMSLVAAHTAKAVAEAENNILASANMYCGFCEDCTLTPYRRTTGVIAYFCPACDGKAPDPMTTEDTLSKLNVNTPPQPTEQTMTVVAEAKGFQLHRTVSSPEPVAVIYAACNEGRHSDCKACSCRCHWDETYKPSNAPHPAQENE